MILRSRQYERKKPDRDATLCIIYCEGSKREPQYFRHFNELSPRLRIEVIKADDQGDNSPSGLFAQACSDIEDPDLGKYRLGKNDEVWFVIDTDDWRNHLTKLRELCLKRQNWYIAQSNPCFEVWLYYHVFSNDAANLALKNCAEWKQYVNSNIPGGFDSKKHPVLLATAIANAEAHFKSNDDGPLYGSTEMFTLGKMIHSMVKSEIDR
ncbi:MAG: RloB family protein [Sphaerochaeta sp.]